MMLQKYLLVFLVSMVPMIELRGAVLFGAGVGPAYAPLLPHLHFGEYATRAFHSSVCPEGLDLGADKPVVGRFFQWCLVKGHRGGEKLKAKSRQGAVFGSDAVRSHPHSRHRRLDRDPGRQLPGHGIQAHRPGRFDGSGHCRYHHDPGGDRRICRIFLPIAGFHVSHTNREKPQFPGISLDFFVHISIHRIKLVGVTGSRSGAGRAAPPGSGGSRPGCGPGCAWFANPPEATSCGVLPWTWFQY